MTANAPPPTPAAIARVAMDRLIESVGGVPERAYTDRGYGDEVIAVILDGKGIADVD